MQAAWRRSGSAPQVALLCVCLRLAPASPLTETQLTPREGPSAPFARAVPTLHRPHVARGRVGSGAASQPSCFPRAQPQGTHRPTGASASVDPSLSPAQFPPSAFPLLGLRLSH